MNTKRVRPFQIGGAEQTNNSDSNSANNSSPDQRHSGRIMETQTVPDRRHLDESWRLRVFQFGGAVEGHRESECSTSEALLSNHR